MFADTMRRIVLGGMAALSLTAAACGSDGPPTPAQARERGANAVCDLQARCENIGVPPAQFTSRDDCVVTWKATIEMTVWPLNQCTRILDTGYDLCIAAINNQGCNDLGGFLTTLSVCSQANVCAP